MTPRDPPPDAPVAVRGRSGSSRAPILGALAIFVLVLGAIGLAQLFPAPRAVAPSPSPPDEAATPAPDATIAPDPSVVPAAASVSAIPASRRLRPAALVEAVVAGRLEGTAVYVDGFLQARCPAAGAVCPSPALAIDGLGLEVVPGAIVGDGLDPAPERGLLALIVRDRALVYLGSFVSDPEGPARPSDVPGAVPLPAPRGTLVEAGGWLLTDPSCAGVGEAPASCPPRTPLLADEPLSGGIVRSDGLPVALSPDLSPAALSAGPVTAGTFLLAPPVAEGEPWRVVARYDPARSVRVVVP